MSLRTSPLRRHDERKWNVDRSSPLPLYVQIRHRLLSLVAQWSRSEGRFYSDDELCRYFGVSRVTVRQAVAELVNEGFLTRVRGSGTYVALKKIEEKFTPPMNMQNTAMASITSLSKKPKLASCVELPPVDTVEKL